MSIAWSTVIVVVLLLPGILFFAGFYFPEKVTRESAPISPLAQLSGVVGIALLLHAIFYGILNYGGLYEHFPSIKDIALDKFIIILRADSSNPNAPSALAFKGIFDRDALNIFIYFVVISGMGFLLGWRIGLLVTNGPLRMLASHQWQFRLLDGKKSAKYVRAHVLSKTSHDGRVLIYDGIVEEFYAKASGTINHLVLKDARSGVLEIGNNVPIRHAGRIPLGDNKEGSFQVLVLTSDDIANVYFEKVASITIVEGDMQKLAKSLADQEGAPAS